MRIVVEDGQTLWEALYKKDIVMERPCGGRGICGRCKAAVEGRGEVLSCQFCEPGSYEVVLPQRGELTAVSLIGDPEEPGAAERIDLVSDRPSASDVRCIAVDVGTTTVAIYAVCTDKTAQRSFVNPQRSYGADVLSRISACCAGRGEELREILQKRLMEELESVVMELEEKEGTGDVPVRTESELPASGIGMEPDRTWRVVVGGNTTMLHILLGYSCEGLGHAPFSPVNLDMVQREESFGGHDFLITCLPGISAYIGADIVSGIYGLRIMEEKSVTLLLDLGTNGEMALGNADRLLCASAAAGPAFEGSDLAVRIHASGIMRVLRELREHGHMDEYGLLEEPYFSEGYPVQDTVITQDDIREVQMAKAAVRAGIEILLREYGILAEEVDEVYLAGGMGYYLNPEDAVVIGLLPEAFLGKIRAAGNTCLLGALRYERERETAGHPQRKLVSLTAAAEEILLADHCDFEELYIEEMNFRVLFRGVQ